MDPDKGRARGDGWLFDRYVATAPVAALTGTTRNVLYFAASRYDDATLDYELLTKVGVTMPPLTSK